MPNFVNTFIRDVASRPVYIVIGLVLVLLSIAASYTTYHYIKQNIQRDLLSSLVTVNETTKKGLQLWMEEEKSVVKSWALNNEILVSHIHSLLAVSPTKNELIEHPATEKIREYLRPLIDSKDYLGFFVISREKINIASMRNGNLGQVNLLNDNEGMLDRALSGETVMSLPQISDVPLRDKHGDLISDMPTMFVVSPVYNKQERIIALLACRINPSKNFTHLLQLGRIGESGETYAFNKNAKLISDSRFDSILIRAGLIKAGQSAILRISVRDPGRDLTRQTFPFKDIDIENAPLTAMAKSATAGISDSNLEGYRDYRGILVVGAWKWNEALGFGITTEIDFDDAYKTLFIIKWAIIGMTVLSMLLLLVTGAFLIRGMNVAEKQSHEDGLTGLANRRMLDYRLKTELDHAVRNKFPLTVCMMDVDHFKVFNDHSGHVAGDDVLRTVASTLESALKRKTDMVARYGGEEFCAILPDTSLEQAGHVAESFRLAIEQKKISRNQADDNPWITVSVGCVSRVFDSLTDINEIFAMADEALYQAKKSGRNCVKFYQE